LLILCYEVRQCHFLADCTDKLLEITFVERLEFADIGMRFPFPLFQFVEQSIVAAPN
jgi:hypothetical protein